jgi:hypothetical protein
MNKETTLFIKFFKGNITLILLGLYALSFVNYYIYYNSFEISIFNYIGLYDLIFFSLEYIFKIVLVIFIWEVLFYIVFSCLFDLYTLYIILIHKKKYKLYFFSNRSKKKRLKNVIFNKYFNDNIVVNKVLFILILMAVIVFSPYKLTTIPALCIYFIYIFHKSDEVKLYDFTITAISFIIIVFTLITTLFSSYSKRFEKDDYCISFYENSKLITTDKTSTYNYLGESSTYIFLYDFKNKESKIYFKENISELKIKNTNNFDTYALNIKESSFVRTFLEMIQRDEVEKKERRESIYKYFK